MQEGSAQWQEGIPQNLEAAAKDGLEWLKVFRRQKKIAAWLEGEGDAKDNALVKLDRTIAELERFLSN